MVFHIYHDVRNEWRWYLASPNGNKIATSGEGYARRIDCVQAIARLKLSVGAPLMFDNVGPLSRMTSAGLFASAISS